MRIITFDIHSEWPESVKNPYCKDTDLVRENTAYWNGVDAAYHSAIEITDEEWDYISREWLRTSYVDTLDTDPIEIVKFPISFSQYLRELIELARAK